MFDGHKDESPSVRGKPNSVCMVGHRNRYTGESKPPVIGWFAPTNKRGKRMVVMQEVKSITDHASLLLV